MQPKDIPKVDGIRREGIGVEGECNNKRGSEGADKEAQEKESGGERQIGK